MNKKVFAACLTFLTFGVGGFAFADDKPIRICNLTSATILNLKLAPAGTKTFGRKSR